MKKLGLSVGEDKEGSNLYATSSFLRASGYLSKLYVIFSRKENSFSRRLDKFKTWVAKVFDLGS